MVLLALLAEGAAQMTNERVRRGPWWRREVGCLSCHRIGPTGNEDVGSDLTTVGSRLTRISAPRAARRSAHGDAAYDHLPADDLDALLDPLSALR